MFAEQARCDGGIGWWGCVQGAQGKGFWKKEKGIWKAQEHAAVAWNCSLKMERVLSLTLWLGQTASVSVLSREREREREREIERGREREGGREGGRERV
jgi:hypothetical protein